MQARKVLPVHAHRPHLVALALVISLFTLSFAYTDPCPSADEFWGLKGRKSTCSGVSGYGEFCPYGSIPDNTGKLCEECPFKLVWEDNSRCLLDVLTVNPGNKIIFFLEGELLKSKVVPCSGREWCPGASGTTGNEQGDPFGRFCPLGMNATADHMQCQTCPGLFSGSYRENSLCLECPPGKILNWDDDSYINTGVACVDAPTGWWSNGGWYTTFEPPAGTFTDGILFEERATQCPTMVTAGGACLEVKSKDPDDGKKYVYMPLIVQKGEARLIECTGKLLNPYTHKCEEPPAGWYVPGRSDGDEGDYRWSSLVKVEDPSHYSQAGSYETVLCQAPVATDAAAAGLIGTVLDIRAKCVTCVPGQYLDTTEMVCKDCIPGYYCDGRDMLRCPPNTYQGSEMFVDSFKSCKKCTNGIVSRQRTHCIRNDFCPSSYYLFSGFDMIEPSNTSSDVTIGQQFCLSCDKTNYAGMYCPNGSLDILECPPDTYMLFSNLDRSTCNPRPKICPISPNRDFCETCPVTIESSLVSYWEKSEGKCAICPPNHKCDNMNIEPCPMDYASTEGSKTCTYCDGVITDRGKCKGCKRDLNTCPLGDPISDYKCEDCGDSCPVGTYWDDMEGRCYDCPAGFACFNSRLVYCPLNLYQDQKRAAHCKQCIGGLPNDTRTGCVPCGDGMYADTEELICKKCPAGSYCQEGVREYCPEGHYQPEVKSTECLLCKGSVNADRTICRTCEDGEFFDDVTVSCRVCPLGHYCYDGEKYPCDRGYYMDVEGATSCLECKGYVVSEASMCLIGKDASQYEYEQKLTNNDAQTVYTTWSVILGAAIVLYLITRRIFRCWAHKHGMRYPKSSKSERQKAVSKAALMIDEAKKANAGKAVEESKKQKKALEKAAETAEKQKQ